MQGHPMRQLSRLGSKVAGAALLSASLFILPSTLLPNLES